MGCINPDGTLAPSAKTVLEFLKSPKTSVEVAQHTGMPMYRVRMSLRELSEAGLLSETDGLYQITEAGLTRLS